MSTHFTSALERWQIALYLGAIGLGWLLGHHWPAVSTAADALLWPALALLLYATFLQLDPGALRTAFGDARFLGAAVLGNFILIPLGIAMLLPWLPGDPALQLGVALILLVPCTDWFLSFNRLGGGDNGQAIAFTPLALLLQAILLPLYLWLLLDEGPRLSVLGPQTLVAFAGLVGLPLTAAMFTRSRVRQRGGGDPGAWVWLPVPLLALVVALVSAAHAELLVAATGRLALLIPVFAYFLLAAALLAWLLAGLLNLPPRQGRVLAFSFGGRNSFVVLPIALALPAGYEVVALVIVLQAMVELAGMLMFLIWIPRLFPIRT